MSTAICPYCEPDTAGRHEASCPNSRVVAAPLTPFPEPGPIYRLEQKINLILAQLRPNTTGWGVIEARMTIWQALQADPGLKDGYVSNIAMLIHDRLNGVDFQKRNDLANEILDLLFKPNAPTGE